MGVYFIAAGTSSNNRYKSLEKSISTSSLQKYLNREEYSQLLESFNENEPVYLWGATETSWRELKQVKRGEYVVDVKNKEVDQIFTYCFRIKGSSELQKYIGWDNARKYDSGTKFAIPMGIAILSLSIITGSSTTASFRRVVVGFEVREQKN